MRRLLTAILLCVAAACATPARAQDPPPPIGLFVVDLHGNVPKLAAETQLAPSRGLAEDELPGAGLGMDVSAHVYVYRWHAITAGLGGRLVVARARSGSSAGSGQATLRGVTERFVAVAPELSFNFGTGDGWSYISGGIGQGTWSVVADGLERTDADRERLRIVHYGAGARWFAKRHLAFSVDVRFYQNDPGSPQGELPGTPRSSNMVFSAGVSVK